MRLETKIAAVVVGIFVIGLGTWYLGAGGQGDKADGVGPVVNAPSDPGIEPGTTGTPEAGTGSVGSPASIGLTDRNEAFPRPHPAESFEPDTRNLLHGRTGLAGRAISGSSPEPDEPAHPSIDPLSDEPVGMTEVGPPSIGGGPHRFTTTRPAGGLPRMGFTETVNLTPTPPEPLVVPGPEPMKTHTIESGDNFSSLAVRYFGNAKYMKRIMEANPDLDPLRLRIGAKVKIPPAPVAVVSPPANPIAPTANETPREATTASALRRDREALPPIPPDRAYTVQPGDSGWWTLAERFLGKGNDWPELYELNKERVGGNSKVLRVGTVIELPPSAAARNRSAP